MSDSASISAAPERGWHVLHLFYRIEHGQWSLLTTEEQIAAKTQLTELIQEIRATEDTQLLVFSVVTPKADIAFMLLTPDLHVANGYEKRLSLGLGPEVLTPVYSFLSLTGENESLPTAEEYVVTSERRRQDKLHPTLPNWEVVCFYPVTLRRHLMQTWHDLSLEEREQQIKRHGKMQDEQHKDVFQFVTGSSGLDDAEWGVTLFAHDLFNIKDAVQEMRADFLSVKFMEFGDFYIGLSLPLDELFRRVQI